MSIFSSKGAKGFTLIELLVVIAIVGILSAIALTQLNTARAKGEDAKKKSALKSLGNAGILYYESVGSYNGLCTDNTYTKFQAILTSINANGTATCAPLGYRVRVSLQSAPATADWLCTDHDGNIKAGANDPGVPSGGVYLCPSSF